MALQAGLGLGDALTVMGQKSTYESVLDGSIALDHACLDGLVAGHHAVRHLVEAVRQALAKLQVGVDELLASVRLSGSGIETMPSESIQSISSAMLCAIGRGL